MEEIKFADNFDFGVGPSWYDKAIKAKCPLAPYDYFLKTGYDLPAEGYRREKAYLFDADGKAYMPFEPLLYLVNREDPENEHIYVFEDDILCGHTLMSEKAYFFVPKSRWGIDDSVVVIRHKDMNDVTCEDAINKLKQLNMEAL